MSRPRPEHRERTGTSPRRSRLFGREEAIARITDTALSTSAPPLVVVAGPTGIGRSSVLAAARYRLSYKHVPTLDFRIAENEHHRPYAVASRLAAELGALHGAKLHTGAVSMAESTIARRLAAAIVMHRQLVVFLDDLQWIDPNSLAVLVPLARTLAGTSITFVCALRSQTADTADTADTELAELRTAGLADVVLLRPLRESETTALLTDLLQAKPSAMVREDVQRLSRGVPAAVLAAAEGHQRTASLRVVDRHAYLVSPGQPPELSADHPLFEHLRRLGTQAWSVVKALAVLYPLGASAGRLVADAVGLDERQVVEVLHRLYAEGVLLAGPKLGTWRFRLPLLAPALTSCLGPFERRRVSQVAVTAIWDGTASCKDDHFLPEQLVSAGKMVDPDRAASELLARGGAVLIDDGYHAERWLRAAAELISDPTQRATVLFLRATACTLHAQFEAASLGAKTLLSEYADQFSPETLQELEIEYVIALRGTNATTELADIAEDGWQSLPGGPEHRIVTKAAALCLLGRYRDGVELLSATEQTWRQSNDASALYGLIFSVGITPLLGRMTEFEASMTELRHWPGSDVARHHRPVVTAWARALAMLGEPHRARQLVATYQVPHEELLYADQAMLASLSGQWDRGLDLARVSLATGTSLGHVPAHTGLCREMATILISRGRLNQARMVIDNARADQPLLTHLLDIPESKLEHVLGAPERAARLLRDGLAFAAEGGVVMGTDELWRRLAEHELASGNRAAALRCADEVRCVAERMHTGRARLNYLLAKASTGHDVEAASEAVKLARERSQPFELANTLTHIAAHGLADAKLLREAYELYGGLDALLPRARLRHLMRARNVSVPGRSATVAENERLLAALVTEGLTNRELAIVLQTSEKSVEGRLSRLFQRTGYRSRVELATAMLTGEYQS